MTKILLIEANEINREMLTHRLQRRGYAVVTAVNAQEGVEKAASERPDLILMDLSWPGWEGWEATRQLKSASPTQSIPVIALSDQAMSREREQAMEAGCDDYDTKPVDLNRLLPKIEALLSSPSPDISELLVSPPVSQQLQARPPETEDLSDTILLVEDNEINRDILRRRLEQQGYGVYLAEDGEQALELLSQHQFRLVLLDVMMPGIGGFEVLKQIRQRFDKTQLPVIMTTARDQSGDVVLASELGANDYVTKPIDFPTILAQIQAQLSLIQSAHQTQQPPLCPSPAEVLADRYLIQKILGEVGFSQTLLVKDTQRPGEPLCLIKQLRLKPAQGALIDTARHLFKTETEILEKLGQHEQIPRLLASFEQDQTFFLVQEYIEGATLSQDLMPGQRLGQMAVINLVGSILKVLEFVHSHQVIHQNIQPDTLMRRAQDHRLVLIDFGVDKRMQAQLEPDHPSNNPVAIGTIGYAPVEQYAGRPTYSSDLYALGLIAIQALTGRSPDQLVPDPTTSELIWRDYAQVSDELAQVLDKMTRRYHRDRYATATEALKDIYRLPAINQILKKRRQQRGPS